MCLLQPSALGRANVAGRVSDGARQNVLANVLIFECGNA